MRSLILAGGGLKVGYQAGCLQVLLDEAGLKFDHVDATSGGCFNAAMMASGMSGTQIANHWREMPAKHFMSLNLPEYWKLLWVRSIGTSGGVRNILRNDWKLDWKKINACTDPVFTFNHFNFTQKRVVVLENSRLDEDYLVASTSIVVWFPPVEKRGEVLFDAVYCTDANIGEAVRRGADEIWTIWTVADTPEFRDGFVAQYFHVIETIADAHFKEEWREIEAVNQAIKTYGPIAGRSTPDLLFRPGFDPSDPPPPPPGRKAIAQYVIQQEVGVHYALNLSTDRMAAAVEMGIRDTRAYLEAKKIAFRPRPYASPHPPLRFQFFETMRGFFMPGVAKRRKGAKEGREAGNRLDVHLTIRTDDLEAYLCNPEHEAKVTGTVDCPLLSGTLMPITAGTFKQFVNERRPGDVKRVIPGRKRMVYDLRFQTPNGKKYRLKGKKYMRSGRGLTVWPDTTTLYTRLYEDSKGWKRYGAGILYVLPLDFLLKELPSFDIPDVPLEKKVAGLGRYAAFFLGHLWDVYLRGLIDYAPF